MVAALAIGRTARAQTVEPGLWIPNGPVNAIATLSDTVFIGGSFTRVQPITGGGAPFDLSTALAATNLPRVHGKVFAVISDGSGGWYIGGLFDSVGTTPRANIARINSDLSVNSWAPGADDAVYSLALSGTTLYMGGGFQHVNTVAKPWLAALNTSTAVLTAWAPATDGPVYAMTISGSTIYVGGQFVSFNTTTIRAYLAALDLTVGTPTAWDPEPDGFVWAMSVASGVLYVGGDFSTVASGATIRNGAAAYTVSTGALSSGWNPNVSGTVHAIAVNGTTVYLGGSFTQIGASAMRNNLAAVATSNGNATSWNPNVNSLVQAIVVNGTSILAGGTFTQVGATPRSRLAAIDASTGAVQAWAPEPDEEVTALAIGGTYLYVGGRFNSGGGVARSNLAALSISTGLPTIWNPNANGPVDALVLGTDVSTMFVYAGGRFTTIGGQARPYLAKIGQGPGSVITGFNAQLDSAVTTLTFTNLTLYVGGRFLHLGGQPRTRAGSVNNAGTATTWAPSLNGTVYSIVPYADTIFVGGAFTTPQLRVAKFDKVGAVLPWSADADNTVYALALNDTTLMMGGDFKNVGGQSRLRFAAVQAGNGTVQPWNPGADSTVRVFDTSAGVFAGGSFVTVNAVSRKGAAAFDNVVDVTRLAPWSPMVVGTVNAIAQYGYRTFIGGSFTVVKGINRANFAVLNLGPRPASVEAGRPASLALAPIAPNPLRSDGHVRFTLSRASQVTLTLYDVSGRRARSVLDPRPFEAGTHEVALRTAGLDPGIYFVHLRAGTLTATRKVILLP